MEHQTALMSMPWHLQCVLELAAESHRPHPSCNMLVTAICLCVADRETGRGRKTKVKDVCGITLHDKPHSSLILTMIHTRAILQAHIHTHTLMQTHTQQSCLCWLLAIPQSRLAESKKHTAAQCVSIWMGIHTCVSVNPFPAQSHQCV